VQVSVHMVNVTWTILDSLPFILHFFNHFLAFVAVVDSVEVGRSAVYGRYNRGPRSLAWGTATLTGERFVYSVSSFSRRCLLCR
jgi:hypothetical protein